MQSGSRRGAPLTAVWDTEKTCESRRCGKTGRAEDCADFVPKAKFAGKRRAEAAAVPDKKVVKSRASGRKSSRSHTKTDLDGEQKFYLCKKCGNLAGMLNDSGAEIKCCDSIMDRLTAVSMGQVSVRADGDKIYVDFSKVPHTVGHDHHIGWVYIKTARGGQRQILYPDMFPEVQTSASGMV